MQLLAQLLMAVGLSACCGLRAFLPLLVTGLLTRGHYIALSPRFDFLARGDVLLVLGIATLLEIAADKVIGIDHALDVIATFARPCAAVILAAGVCTSLDPFAALVLGLIVGGSTSLVVHAGKTAARLKATTLAPLHHGLGNAAMSVAEDGLTAVGLLLVVVAPIVAFLLALAMVAAAAWMLVVFVRAAGRWTGLFAKRETPTPTDSTGASAS